MGWRQGTDYHRNAGGVRIDTPETGEGWSPQTRSRTRRALRRSREGLQTNQNASAHPKTAGRGQTHLVEAQSRTEEPQRPGDHADASEMHTHTQSGRIEAKTIAKIAEVIRKTPKEPKTL